ncbi:MAG: tetratricopeptide repeat protein, partial [Gemmatimonadota bacterium]|nr:tetratricopeptide repeat protein [Gemmatimonadota bacterium]
DLSAPAEVEPEPVGGETEFAEIGGFEVDSAEKSLEEAAEEVAAEIPTMDLDASDDDEDGEAVELPMMGFDDSDDDDDFELPTLAFAEDDDEDEEVELPTIPYDDEDDDEVTAELLTVEAADDDGFESSAALEEAIEEAAPEPAPAPPAPTPPPAEPAAPAQDYVDFGAMILGGGGGDEKSTRFRVAYEEPSGDEEADFAKMLSQFKDKVSENLDSGDVRAHYDLGTAYKEMGLLEEAISSFQQALRASAVHLPTYEIMGQTFIEMGQPEAAVRTLERALHVTPGVEDEFVGIYYYLARAFEALDRKDSAVEYYDRVFSLDINFADVTERLRELR